MKSMRLLIVLSLTLCSINLFSQGLYIKGNESIIDFRTSYNVFDRINPTFNDLLHVEFYMMPRVSSRGSIVRIKNEENKNTFCITYNGEGYYAEFSFNYEGKETLISHTIEKSVLTENLWVKIILKFNLKDNLVTFRVNDQTKSTKLSQNVTTWKPTIHFGKSEHVIDIPPYRICKLTIKDHSKEYHFPLDESEGEYVHNTNKKIIGHVSNPTWLINDSYYWKAGPSFSSNIVAGSNFNPITQEVYFFNKDSITIYNTRTAETHTYKYNNECPMTFRLGTNFLDKKNNKLYVYEVADPLSGNVVMASLDLTNLTWQAITDQVLPMQLHHHASYMDDEKGNFTIFGGFGNTSYYNNFYTFNLSNTRWEKLNLNGDNISPRYFSSMGIGETSNDLFIFGGMGNEIGNQLIGRVYYYELYKVDLEQQKIVKHWSIPWDSEYVVPARNLVLTNNDSFYALCYPEHFSRTHLKLYNFSTTTGQYNILGDSIPVISEKITTNVNLFYDNRSSQLITLVQEFQHDDIASTMKIFTLSFPPVTKEELIIYHNSYQINWLRILLIALSIVASMCMIFIIIKKKKLRSESKDEKILSQEDITLLAIENNLQAVLPNSIHLFGDFSLTDRNGREINYMLSNKLKHTFFLILFYSLQKKRLSSHELSEHLWPNKSYNKAKNSRGVVLNNLRKVLSELDGISLVHENGNYKFVYSNTCYCDYLRCHEITVTNHENDLEEFVTIVSRGKFLNGEDVSIMDSVKEYFESRVESASYFYTEKAYAAGKYQTVIILCESIFEFDPLDENALRYTIKALTKLDKINEAKQRYYLFVVEYKKIIGEDYLKSFDELSK